MIKNNNQNLTQLLTNAVNNAPNKQALIGLNHVMTYQDLHKNSLSLAHYLCKHADNDKGTVALMLPNLLSFPVALFGVWYADKTATLVNPLYTSDELLKQCLDAQVSIIIIAKIFYKTLRPVFKQCKIKQVIVVEVGDCQPTFKRHIVNLVSHFKRRTFMIKKQTEVGYISLHNILKDYSSVLLDEKLNNEVALLQYTGGTSGVLKAAKLKHENILANIYQLEQWLPKDINTDSLTLTALPLYHIFALTVNCLLFIRLQAGNVLVLNPRDMKQLVAPLKKHNITVITGVNTLFAALVKHQDFKKLNFSTLKVAISGGMPLDKKTSEQWQSIIGKPIIQGYGLTECSPVVSAESYKTNKFSGSVGLPLVDTQIKILDPSDHTMPINEIGEIVIKGPQVMDAYWHKEALNQTAFTQDGYFRSGDVGYIDTQGQIFIVDRIKDMIIVSGFNVYPGDVERILNQHPDVIESACIGVDNDISGQTVKAFVVKKLGSILKKQTLINHCKQHLTAYKIPNKIEWIDVLPKSSVGKILKRKLK